MVISFLEMISNLSLDRLLVQAPDGNNVRFQRVAHFLQAARGIISFAILLILAAPLSILFSIPQAKLAFYFLALIPLMNGFWHLDPRRMERDMQFWPNASVELTSQVILLILAWPLGRLLGDYRAMLYLLIIKAIISLIGTHIVAKRNYRWSSEKQYITRFLAFGWPLIINGLLLFVVLQGDRFLIGSAQKLFGVDYNMADVGVYSAAFILTMMPAMMLIKINASLLLPILSREQNSSISFLSKADLFSQLITLIAVIFSTVMILVGDRLLLLFYGNEYSTACDFIGWLSILWGFRIVRVLPASISMAKGKTKILMKTNLIRALALFGILLVVMSNNNLIWIAAIGAIGEIIAYLICSAIEQTLFEYSFEVIFTDRFLFNNEYFF